MSQDPFSRPGVIPSAFPKVQSLQGRLVLFKPKSVKTVPNNLGGQGAMQEQMTVDVTVVDGAGPVPVFNQRQHTGAFLEGPDFPGMWISSEVIVKQLLDALTAGGQVLARVNVPNPALPAGKGNAWGLVDPTEEDLQTARNFLANRTVAATSAPGPVPAPVIAQNYAQAVPAPGVPQQQFAAPPQPAYVPPTAATLAQQQMPAAPAPTAPQPTGYVPGANPFATQQPAG